MKIADGHVHFWDLGRNPYPWLQGPDSATFFGDNQRIRHDYLPSCLRRDAEVLDIAKVVHVQANWLPSDPVGETRWLDETAHADAEGWPNAIVAYVDLAAANAAAVLDQHCMFDNMRGIRHVLFRSVLDPTAPDHLANPTWRANLQLLGLRGISFDMMIFPQQMRQSCVLIDENPRTLFVIEHAGCPQLLDLSRMEVWRVGLRDLARRPNAVLKISGLGMFDPGWNAESVRSVVLECIDSFGADRVMFASNFPVDSLMSSYSEVWKRFFEITKGHSEAERDAMFFGNVEKFYRI
jgi:predicted TIM-barrel fold metal-dependent hydrolase